MHKVVILHPPKFGIEVIKPAKCIGPLNAEVPDTSEMNKELLTMGTICMPINVKIHWLQMDVRLLHSAYSETAACKDKAGNATFGEFAYRGGIDESVFLWLMFDTEIRRMSPFGRSRRCT